NNNRTAPHFCEPLGDAPRDHVCCSSGWIRDHQGNWLGWINLSLRRCRPIQEATERSQKPDTLDHGFTSKWREVQLSSGGVWQSVPGHAASAFSPRWHAFRVVS